LNLNGDLKHGKVVLYKGSDASVGDEIQEVLLDKSLQPPAVNKTVLSLIIFVINISLLSCVAKTLLLCKSIAEISCQRFQKESYCPIETFQEGISYIKAREKIVVTNCTGPCQARIAMSS
jgi:hypothetical protein